ncbi:hypothetical protein WIW50_12710 [Flavobacteriaceae bacterium 3-367]|uniref:hypothetical protein n=1 Tax=Eudoraea algarum TaxID=3417568 RepID=UPI00328C2AB0
MKFLLRLLNWKRSLVLSIGTLGLLVLLNFYGLHTNKFYFFKFDNYIFPLLTLVHFTFLYAIWFKIKEEEIADPQMRNLEYTLYVIFLVYLYKAMETLSILLSYSDYADHVMPVTFIPMGIAIFALYLLLMGLTLVTFVHRKKIVGSYNFEQMNQHFDSWE